MTDHIIKTFPTTLNYSVVDHEDNILREGSITSRFPDGMSWIDEIDVLSDLAYELEGCGGEGKECMIQNE